MDGERAAETGEIASRLITISRCRRLAKSLGDLAENASRFGIAGCFMSRGGSLQPLDGHFERDAIAGRSRFKGADVRLDPPNRLRLFDDARLFDHPRLQFEQS